MINVTCKKCGWVHMGVTREHAEAEVKRFNDYYDTLSPEKQNDYYGKRRSHIGLYARCWCGNDQFRPSKDDDCPVGCTIGPVIYE